MPVIASVARRPFALAAAMSPVTLSWKIMPQR
jgi:hypothetical protein